MNRSRNALVLFSLAKQEKKKICFTYFGPVRLSGTIARVVTSVDKSRVQCSCFRRVKISSPKVNFLLA